MSLKYTKAIREAEARGERRGIERAAAWIDGYVEECESPPFTNDERCEWHSCAQAIRALRVGTEE